MIESAVLIALGLVLALVAALAPRYSDRLERCFPRLHRGLFGSDSGETIAHHGLPAFARPRGDRCAARRCITPRATTGIMCARHWRMLTPEYQEWLFDTWVGSTADRVAVVVYLEALSAACDHIELAEARLAARVREATR